MNETHYSRKGGTMHEDYDDDYEAYLDERYEREYARYAAEQASYDRLIGERVR